MTVFTCNECQSHDTGEAISRCWICGSHNLRAGDRQYQDMCDRIAEAQRAGDYDRATRIANFYD